MSDQNDLSFDAACSMHRLALKAITENTSRLMTHPAFETPTSGMNVAEMKANVMLAYRHLEDAAMRLGKAVQAFDGGKSVYDDKDRMRISAA